MCDDDDDGDDLADGTGFNLTGPGELSQDLFNSRNSTLNSIGDLNGTLLAGENLVAQPNKVCSHERIVSLPAGKCGYTAVLACYAILFWWSEQRN